MKKLSLTLMIAAALLLVSAQLGWTTPTALAAPPSNSHIVHVVQWGQTLSGIALRYGTTWQAIASYNGIVNPNLIYAGQRLVIPSSSPPPSQGFWYTVRYGDTLSGIAWRYGRNVWSIANANGITNPNVIYAGQRLWIP